MSYLAKCLCLLFFVGLAPIHFAFGSPELSIRGEHFVDAQGRVTILRGVNVSGDTKTPPFLPFAGKSAERDPSKIQIDFSKFDQLRDWGMNTVRLLFVWEAFEPESGKYDDVYLQRITEVVDAAWARGLYVVLDMHQDVFSRYIASGCGIGFPAWLTPDDAAKFPPGPRPPCSSLWGVGTGLSSRMHRAFRDFYANRNDGRAHFIEMWRALARYFKGHPGVVGYDLLNEPWGDEKKGLGPLYEDVARAIHGEDSSAILFVEPHVLTVLGFKAKTKLPRPTFDNFVYAPHFYDGLGKLFNDYVGWNPLVRPFFKRMPRQAHRWGVPLYVGEFGAFSEAKGASSFMDRQYDLLDAVFASGAQWNYTPDWTPVGKDGWNHEDYSIVDDHGRPRASFRVRPYPRKIAGKPDRFIVERARKTRATLSIRLDWTQDVPGRVTELFVPRAALFGGREVRVTATGGASCAFDAASTLVLCQAATAGPKSVVVAAEVSAPARK